MNLKNMKLERQAASNCNTQQLPYLYERCSNNQLLWEKKKQ